MEAKSMMGGMVGGMAMVAWVWALLGLALLALVVVALVWGVRSSLRPATAAAGGPTPLEALKYRYARGEIDREEYLERRVSLEPEQR
jgi:putative membrane protein